MNLHNNVCESTPRPDGITSLHSPPASSLPLSRIGLNSHKAGMEGLDRDKINQIILEASRGSKYYQNEVRRDQEISKRVTRMLHKLRNLAPAQRAAAIKVVDKEVEEMEKCRDLSRIIVHVDMDAFYAAVEMRNNPVLKDCPMAVGSNSMLSTSNYIARRYGVRAAMPGFIAKKLCPKLVIVEPNYSEYHESSEKVKKVLAQYDPNFCPVGLDESYLDISDYVKKKMCSRNTANQFLKKTEDYFSDAHDSESKDSFSVNELWVCAGHVVQEMREEIQKATGLTASAGIAPNKMLAKIASDANKPNGQLLVEPTREAILQFVHELPIRKICGIGKVAEKMLNALDITLCCHLYEKRDVLHLLFPQTSSNFFLSVSLGVGSIEVQRSNKKKSISTERSFKEISEPKDHLAKCQELCQILASDMDKEGIKGQTVTVKMKTIDFEVKSRGTTVPMPVWKYQDLFQIARELLEQEIVACGCAPLRLRLMGVRVSNLQLSQCDNNQGTLKSFLKPVIEPEQVATIEIDTASTTSDAGVGVSSLQLSQCGNNQGTLKKKPVIEPEQVATTEIDTASTCHTTSDAGVRVSECQETLKSFLKPVIGPDHKVTTMKIGTCHTSSDTGIMTSHKSHADPSTRKPNTTTLPAECPLCGSVVSAENLILNQHIDECLNKSAIKEAIDDFQQDSKSMPLKASGKKSSKRGHDWLTLTFVDKANKHFKNTH